MMPSFRPVPLARRHSQRDHHAKPEKIAPGDEIGREDRRVPPGQLMLTAKSKRHDRVHGEHQRRGEGGQQQVGAVS